MDFPPSPPCLECGGSLDAEDPPTENGLPDWYAEGTCCQCAFEAFADAEGLGLEETRERYGHLFFANPGNVDPDMEARVLAENARIAAEHQD